MDWEYLLEQLTDLEDIDEAKQLLAGITPALLQSLQTNFIGTVRKTAIQGIYGLQLLELIYSYRTDLANSLFKAESIFQLIAVTKGTLNYVLIAQLKNLFLRNTSREPKFWGLTDYTELCSELSRGRLYNLGWSERQHREWAEKVSLVVWFFNFPDHHTFLPFNLDFSVVLFGYLMTLRIAVKEEAQVFQKTIRLFFTQPHHRSTINSQLFAPLQAFKHTLNQKVCGFTPNRSIVELLGRFSEMEISSFILNSCVSIEWTSQSLSNAIRNCLRCGLTFTSINILCGFIKSAINKSYYHQLKTAYEANLKAIFLFLRQPIFFKRALTFLQLFVVAPFPSQSLLALFTSLLTETLPKLTLESRSDLQELTACVLYKYRLKTSYDLQALQSLLVNPALREDKKIADKCDILSWKGTETKGIPSSISEQLSRNRGLINVGNSCYMNSFLQCLFYTDSFKRLVLETSPASLHMKMMASQNNRLSAEAAKDLFKPLIQLQKLFVLLLRSDRQAISPNGLKAVSHPDFRNYLQHDSLQFGRQFLEQLGSFGLPSPFSGFETISLQCQSCLSIRSKQEQFLDIMLQIAGMSNVEKALISNSKPEMIGDLHCQGCNSPQPTLRSTSFHKLPQNLIITLKRFTYDKSIGQNVKIIDAISLSKTFQIGETVYLLYSVIVHRGSSANSGHYYSFCRDLKSQWLCLNDADVSTVGGDDLLDDKINAAFEDTPYICFYQAITATEVSEPKPIVLKESLEAFLKADNAQFVKEIANRSKINLRDIFNVNHFAGRDHDEGGNGNGLMSSIGSFVI